MGLMASTPAAAPGQRALRSPTMRAQRAKLPAQRAKDNLAQGNPESIRGAVMANKSMKVTGASGSVHFQVVRGWPLAPADHAQRWVAELPT